LRIFVSFFITALLLAASAGLSPAGAAPADYRIRDIDFKGVRELDQSKLAATLITQQRPFWKFWTAMPEVAHRDIEDDLIRIKQFYRARGFYQNDVRFTIDRVHPDRCAPSGSNQKEGSENLPCVIDLTFQVKQGPPVRIEAIDWQLPETRQDISAGLFEPRIPLRKGRVFTTDAYNQAKQRIKRMLGNRGFPLAKVEGHVRVDLNSNTARIVFTVDPGDAYCFGPIRISGNNGFVAPHILHRAITFESGHPFSSEQLDESRRHLFELNVFKTARIDIDQPDCQSDSIPVNIQVEPRKRQSMELGVGYGTEDGLRLRGAWRYRNLTGYADRFSVSARRSDLVENIQSEYLWPYFIDKHNTLKARAGFQEEESEFFSLRKIFANVSLRRRMSNHWFISPWYRFTIDRPTRFDDVVLESGTYAETFEDYRISSVKFDLDRISVDNELNPTMGSVLHYSIEGAHTAIGTDISYYQPTVEAKAYVPLPFDMTIAARVRFRTIKELEDTENVPIFLRHFLGGSKTVRGYGYQQLGIFDDKDQLVGVGGKSSFCSNLELRFPIYGQFFGVAFFDMGVLDKDAFRYDFSRMRYTTGLGIRFNTIIGPVQGDVGYKINPPVTSIFETESAETSRWHLHLNIGHAF